MILNLTDDTETWNMFTKEEDKVLKMIPKCSWTTESTDVGTLTDCPPVQIRIEGIRPVIRDYVKSGVLIPCPESPGNTPTFPVKKVLPSSEWRMVQDLKAVNAEVDYLKATQKIPQFLQLLSVTVLATFEPPAAPESTANHCASCVSSVKAKQRR